MTLASSAGFSVPMIVVERGYPDGDHPPRAGAQGGFAQPFLAFFLNGCGDLHRVLKGARGLELGPDGIQLVLRTGTGFDVE
jgi:hypothetical protein